MKISTAQEAINGNSNDTVITPLRLKQVLNSKNIGGGGSGGVTKETDPIFKASPAGSITTSDVAKWNAKQEALVSGQNIKKINGQDILGEGNIVIEGGSGSIVEVSVGPDEPTNNEKVWFQTIGNLFNKEAVTNGYWIKEDGTYYNHSQWFVSDYIPVIPGEKYTYSGFKFIPNTVSGKICNAYYDSDKKLVSTFVRDAMTGTITIPSGVSYIRFSVYRYSMYDSEYDDLSSFQFEKGSVATGYKPYSEKQSINILSNDSYEEFLNVSDLLTKCDSVTIEETDPTVPDYVKAITQADIDKWNSGTGGGTGGGGNVVSETNDMITASLEEAVEIEATNTAQTINTFVEKSKVGDKFYVENGIIKIGAGVSKIILSYGATCQSTVSSTRTFTYILHNDKAISQESYYFSNTGQQVSSTIASALIDVQEGDTFTLRCYGYAGNKILGHTGFKYQTYITIEEFHETNVISGGSGNITPTDFNTEWKDAELTEHFKLYNDSSYCRYAKIGNMVNVQFVLSPTSANNVLNSATETTAFTLPEEYRPSQNLNVLCQGSSTYVFNVGVNKSGNVNIYRYRNGASYSSTPPSTTAWLPCNITYFVDSGELIVGSGGSGSGSDYELPIASKDTLGGVKIGNNLIIDESGTLHANVNGGGGSGLTVDMIYPIGSIYMSVINVNPSTLFTGTTWEQIKDTFLLAAGDTYEAGTSGGSDTHKHGLTSGWAHINSSGKTIIYQYKTGTSWKANYQVVGSSNSSSSTSYSDVTTLGGTTDAGSNLPPYLTVYMWIRIA